MLAPRKVKFAAAKKLEENIEFRTYLKCNADEKELDEQFLRLPMNCLRITIAADVGIAAKCFTAAFR